MPYIHDFFSGGIAIVEDRCDGPEKKPRAQCSRSHEQPVRCHVVCRARRNFSLQIITQGFLSLDCLSVALAGQRLCWSHVIRRKARSHWDDAIG